MRTHPQESDFQKQRLPATTRANAHTLTEPIPLEFAVKTLKLKMAGKKTGNISCSPGIEQIPG